MAIRVCSGPGCRVEGSCWVLPSEKGPENCPNSRALGPQIPYSGDLKSYPLPWVLGPLGTLNHHPERNNKAPTARTVRSYIKLQNKLRTACVHVCTVCTFLHMCRYIYFCFLFIYIHTYTYLPTYLATHTCRHTHIHSYVCVYAHVYVCMYVGMYMFILVASLC